jgi:hypothetical protein
MSANNVAVITGGASGIGLAAAMRFAGLGMKVCIADLDPARLAEAETRISSVASGGAADIMVATVDVSRIDDVSELETAVRERFGGADILMNNAGIQPGSEMFGSLQAWRANSHISHGHTGRNTKWPARTAFDSEGVRPRLM